jgi:hypothetical protein
MTIPPPKIANDYPDRPLECQFAIEPAFQDLVGQAHEAGWSDSEVAAALIDLAHNHMRGMIAAGKFLAEYDPVEPARIVGSRNIEAEDIEDS